MPSTTRPLTPREVLAVELRPEENGAGATSVRGYLVALLVELWEHEEGFSGKRPFGDSGWKHDLAVGLVRAGAVEGYFDEDGYLDTYENWAVDELVATAIAELGAEDGGSGG